MKFDQTELNGLSSEEVETSRLKFGENRINFKKTSPFIAFIKDLAKEPMVVLLLIAAVIYFVIGDIGDGIFLIVAILLVASISLFQDSRSRKAIDKLKDFTQAQSKVIRNGELQFIDSEEIVIGDFIVVEEGMFIPADGEILYSNDFTVNESMLTGESFSVIKNKTTAHNIIFKGTTVLSGLAVAKVKAIAQETALGKIGKSLHSIQVEQTPLEIQINDFVKRMVIAGLIVFLLVWGINFFNTNSFLDSLLNALTLAMSILPEEIPVAFTTFMALGAWRMMNKGIIVKQMKTVEALGLATTICVDKTGTITENKMELAQVYDFKTDQILLPKDVQSAKAEEVLAIAMWASEPVPFDPMEVALHDAYGRYCSADERSANKMIFEYPLGGKPPMMTHVFEGGEKERIIAAKGAPEAIMAVSDLEYEEQAKINQIIEQLASKGYRLLGVGRSYYKEEQFPETQQELKFDFLGLVAFYDPPKQNISAVFKAFGNAGIKVKIITGDNEMTTNAIAHQIDFIGADQTMSGSELMTHSEEELIAKVGATQIFTRMFPAAKLRIINALKAKGEVVAMTGDGVNDGPALKAAHIGIAMGKRGTELAKEASSLIITDDDLARMLDAIAMGRKIYANLKKAIRYIISIHIPIILIVFLPLALGWIYPNIFSPVHVILLELIMGPTCSIIYENEPIERGTMLRKPRKAEQSFFNKKELLVSIIQGLGITVGTLVIYQIAVGQGQSEAFVRTMVFTSLISANIFLTLVNRSFEHYFWQTLRYKNPLIPLIIGVTVLLLGVMLFLPPVNEFLELTQLSVQQIMLSLAIGFLSVMWFEFFKGTSYVE